MIKFNKLRRLIGLEWWDLHFMDLHHVSSYDKETINQKPGFFSFIGKEKSNFIISYHNYTKLSLILLIWM